MVASYDTVEAVLRVVSRHIDGQTLDAIFTDLLKVNGNTSFEATIKRIHNRFKELQSVTFKDIAEGSRVRFFLQIRDGNLAVISNSDEILESFAFDTHGQLRFIEFCRNYYLVSARTSSSIDWPEDEGEGLTYDRVQDFITEGMKAAATKLRADGYEVPDYE